MNIELVALIYFGSVAILVLEVFLPSGGVLAVLGCMGLIASIYYGFAINTFLGVGLLIASTIAIPLMFYYGLKKMALGKKLSVDDGFRSDSPVSATTSSLVNKEGIALTNLRPSGAILIDGKRIDVVTEGEMIDKNTPVRVVKIEGS
ncbi:MAG: NfeD family protein, partial [Planctomycetota bacterium]|nr:NfeD family protein [Planctomycetota bacterium]